MFAEAIGVLGVGTAPDDLPALWSVEDQPFLLATVSTLSKLQETGRVEHRVTPLS